MTSKASINLVNERLLQVAGDINFMTAVTLWNHSVPLLAKCKDLTFDFSQVADSNSAALALLLEWLKYAKRERKTICFQHLPAKMLSVARVAGIDKLLPQV